ncbi:MAG: hypothetical protein VW518_00820 [Burkholderiaceae bacterium]
MTLTGLAPTVTVESIGGPTINWQGGGAGQPGTKKKKRRTQHELFEAITATLEAVVAKAEAVESAPADRALPIVAQLSAQADAALAAYYAAATATHAQQRTLEALARATREALQSLQDSILAQDEEDWMMWL